MAYRDSTATTTTGTSINATKPALVKTGDILLCYLLTDTGLNAPAPTVTAPAGWSLISGSNQGANSSAPDGWTSFVYWRLAGNSETATYTFSVTGSATQIIALVGCWSGRNPNPTFITHGTVNTTGNATPVTVSDTGITANTNDDVIVFANGDITVGTDTWAFTPPSNYTERQDSQVSFNVATLATRDEVFSGATGTLSLTITRSAGTGTSGWGIFVIAIPAAYTRPMLTPIFLPRAGMNIKLVELHAPKPSETPIGSTDTPINTAVGQISIDGFASTISISDNKTVSAGLGQVTITGFSSVISISINVSLGQLTLNGLTPVIQVGININAGVGVITVTGFSPTALVSNNISVAAGVGVLSINAFVAVINKSLNVNTGVLTVTGFSPSTSVSNNQHADPGAGAIALSGFAPQVSFKINAGLGQLTVTGFATTVNVSNNITDSPGTAILSLNGFIPVINKGMNAGIGAISINGFAPNILTPVSATTATGVLVITGQNPALLSPGNVFTGTGVININGFASSVLLPVSISTETGIIDLTGLAPTINIKIFVDAGAVIISGLSPILLIVPPGTFALPGTGHLLFTGFRVNPPEEISLYSPISTPETMSSKIVSEISFTSIVHDLINVSKLTGGLDMESPITESINIKSKV